MAVYTLSEWYSYELAISAELLAYGQKLANMQKNIRPIQFIYVDCSLFKRIKNMRKRNDSWKKIIQRIYNDQKAFKGAKEFIQNLDNGIIMEV